jgi:hypothetical protein
VAGGKRKPSGSYKDLEGHIDSTDAASSPVFSLIATDDQARVIRFMDIQIIHTLRSSKFCSGYLVILSKKRHTLSIDIWANHQSEVYLLFYNLPNSVCYK